MAKYSVLATFNVQVGVGLRLLVGFVQNQKRFVLSLLSNCPATIIVQFYLKSPGSLRHSLSSQPLPCRSHGCGCPAWQVGDSLAQEVKCHHNRTLSPRSQQFHPADMMQRNIGSGHLAPVSWPCGVWEISWFVRSAAERWRLIVASLGILRMYTPIMSNLTLFVCFS